MSQFREGIFEGACVSPESGYVFERADRGDHTMLKMAKIACEECRFKPDCRRDFGDLALRLSECGVTANTVIGGGETEQVVPPGLVPLGDDPVDVLAKIRLGLQTGALTINCKALPSAPGYQEVLTEVLAHPSDMLREAERSKLASLTYGLIRQYNRKVHGEHLVYSSAKGASRREPRVRSTTSLQVGVASLIVEEIQALRNLGINSSHADAIAYVYEAEDIARAIGKFGAHPALTRHMVLGYIMSHTGSFKRALKSHIARFNYVREVIEPQLQTAERVLLTDAEVKYICWRKAAEVESAIEQKIISKNQLVRTSSEEVIDAEDDQTLRSYIGRPGFTVDVARALRLYAVRVGATQAAERYMEAYGAACEILEGVDAPDWIARQLATRHLEGDEVAFAQRWRKNFFYLSEKYTHVPEMTRIQLCEAAFSPRPEIELESLDRQANIDKSVREVGTKLMGSIRQYIRDDSTALTSRTRDAGRRFYGLAPVICEIIESGDYGKYAKPKLIARQLEKVIRFCVQANAIDWQPQRSDPDLEALVKIYMADVASFGRLGFRAPAKMALSYGLEDYRAILNTWDGDKDVSAPALRLLMAGDASTLAARIGEFKARASYLRKNYEDILSSTLIARIALGRPGFEAMLHMQQEQLDEAKALMRAYPWLKDLDVGRFMTLQVGTRKLHEWTKVVDELRSQYANHKFLNTSHFKLIVPMGHPSQGPQSVENFLQEIKKVLMSDIRPKGMTDRTLIWTVAQAPRSYSRALQKVAARSTKLKERLGEDIEDFVICALARKGADYLANAQKWQSAYQELKDQWSGHELYSEWMAQRAALRPEYTNYIKALMFLQKSLDDRQLRIDSQRGESGSWHDALADPDGSVEDQYFQADDDAEQQQKREKIAQLFGSLTEHERAAVVLICNLAEELAPSHLQDEDLLKQELGVKDLTSHVMSKLIPKMQKAAGDGGII